MLNAEQNHSRQHESFRADELQQAIGNYSSYFLVVLGFSAKCQDFAFIMASYFGKESDCKVGFSDVLFRFYTDLWILCMPTSSLESFQNICYDIKA